MKREIKKLSTAASAATEPNNEDAENFKSSQMFGPVRETEGILKRNSLCPKS